MKYLIFAFVVCLAALAVSVKSCQRVKDDRDRLGDNQRTLFEQATYYRTKDSLSAASVERLTLSKAEVERYNKQLVATIKQLGIKLNRVQAAGTVSTATDYNITAPLRDTTVLGVPEPLQAQAFRWSNTWALITGIIKQGEIDCQVHTIDTLVQVIHRVPKRFLFFNYGTKAIRQEIVSKNPNSTIVFNEYIELKK